MSFRPRLVMDLDGTICEQTSGGEAYFSAQPVQKVIDQMRWYRSQGWEIVIQTARGMNLYDGDLKRIEFNFRRKTEQWLKDNDVPYDALYFGKVAGTKYVDDKMQSISDFLGGLA